MLRIGCQSQVNNTILLRKEDFNVSYLPRMKLDNKLFSEINYLLVEQAFFDAFPAPQGSLKQAFFFNTTWKGGRGQVLPNVEFFLEF